MVVASVLQYIVSNPMIVNIIFLLGDNSHGVNQRHEKENYAWIENSSQNNFWETKCITNLGILLPKLFWPTLKKML